MSVDEGVRYGYLSKDDSFTFARFAISDLSKSVLIIGDENIAKAKLQVEALRAEEDAFA